MLSRMKERNQAQTLQGAHLDDQAIATLQRKHAIWSRAAQQLAELALSLHQVDRQHANKGALAHSVILQAPGECLHTTKASVSPLHSAGSRS